MAIRSRGARGASPRRCFSQLRRVRRGAKARGGHPRQPAAPQCSPAVRMRTSPRAARFGGEPRLDPGRAAPRAPFSAQGPREPRYAQRGGRRSPKAPQSWSSWRKLSWPQGGTRRCGAFAEARYCGAAALLRRNALQITLFRAGRPKPRRRPARAAATRGGKRAFSDGHRQPCPSARRGEPVVARLPCVAAALRGYRARATCEERLAF